MERWQNRVAVVTGASSGIGTACAKVILAAGVKVVGLARRSERLEELKKSLPVEQQKRFFFKKCDVSQEEDVKSAFQWVDQELGGTDILVNNAGTLREGNLVDMPMKDIKDVVNTNFMGAIYCTQGAFRSMKGRNAAGHLIFINSTAGLAGYNPGPDYPSLNVYTPTKHGLNAINEICRQELITLKTKVKTTNISPGWVSTEIVSDETKEMLRDVILQADDVANAVIYALSSGPHCQIQEITLRAVGEWH
uniref:Short chain dehydrogenase n=1 Tax=Musca domestica TaxID=7370 RepID=A0A1I8MUJ7_MUSDO